MDLYVERQCIDQMKEGNEKQFLKLFEEYFESVYRYIARRVPELSEADRITRMTFFDALGQIRNTPTDISYLVWLYSLAKPRVWAYMNKASFPQTQGLIDKSEVEVTQGNESAEILAKAAKMISKLSLEEREILKLKFFEQVADGDVMFILNEQEANIGPKIYRVLKRAHFLLFGESDERQGVYFGELTGLIERVKELEDINIPEVLKLTLKNEIMNKIERKDFAINADIVNEISPIDETKPFEVKSEEAASKPKGSNDPAKIFVEAVEEMKQKEALEKIKEQRKQERRENLVESFERWKGVLAVIPVLLFVFAVAFVIVKVVLNQGVERGYPTSCNIVVNYEGGFSDGEIRSVNKGISNRICDHFDTVSELTISRSSEGKVDVAVVIKDWNLMYNFVKKVEDWRIKKYERSLISDRESGEI